MSINPLNPKLDFDRFQYILLAYQITDIGKEMGG